MITYPLAGTDPENSTLKGLQWLSYSQYSIPIALMYGQYSIS